MWNVYVNRLLACCILMQLLMVLSTSLQPFLVETDQRSDWPNPDKMARRDCGCSSYPHHPRLQDLHDTHSGTSFQILPSYARGG
jgi:hypothetical protein